MSTAPGGFGVSSALIAVPVDDFWLSGPTEVVIQSIREASEPTAVYWLMNALASVIASYGLLSDSPAVVIGAMVVAMLLGPISGVALGLNQGDARLLVTAGRTLVGGALWILAIALAVGLVHRDAPLTSEILSRTNARLFDLIIALAEARPEQLRRCRHALARPSSGLRSRRLWPRRLPRPACSPPAPISTRRAGRCCLPRPTWLESNSLSRSSSGSAAIDALTRIGDEGVGALLRQFS